MGGVNHQPCNRAGTRNLSISTRMSRAFTSARAEFETANVCLEDVILSEIDHGRPNHSAYSHCMGHLAGAVAQMTMAGMLTEELEAEMKAKGYESLPAFAHYRSPEQLDELGAYLAEQGILKIEAFRQVAHPQLTEGFYGALRVLREAIAGVRQDISDLHDQMVQAAPRVHEGRIADELETNGALNFRTSFMRTYASWNRCYDLFLASAAMSTELWYQSMGYGSLVNEGRSALKQTA